MSNLSPFGGGKNPPWVRNAGKSIALLKYAPYRRSVCKSTTLPNFCYNLHERMNIFTKCFLAMFDIFLKY